MLYICVCSQGVFVTQPQLLRQLLLPPVQEQHHVPLGQEMAMLMELHVCFLFCIKGSTTMNAQALIVHHYGVPQQQTMIEKACGAIVLVC